MKASFLFSLLAISLLATGCITLTTDGAPISDPVPVLLDEEQFMKHVEKYENDIATLRDENSRLAAEISALKRLSKGRKSLSRKDLEQLIKTMVDAESEEMAARLEAERRVREERAERERHEREQVDESIQPIEEEAEEITPVEDDGDNIDAPAIETP